MPTAVPDRTGNAAVPAALRALIRNARPVGISVPVFDLLRDWDTRSILAAHTVLAMGLPPSGSSDGRLGGEPRRQQFRVLIGYLAGSRGTPLQVIWWLC